ncbi:MAG: virulence protein SciE type, partial [Thermoanaerobaculia bacterium]|nr:virulence protein SciE type [Thermoanaerobaculia bacterium]
EPLAWVAQLIQALRPGDAAARAKLRAEAFEAAPALPGKVNGFEFPWLADADSRLGPLLEAHMEGKYYWIPFARIQRLSLEAPTDLRHLVWVPAQVTWVTGGESSLLIPTRYAGSETVADDRVRLARRTEWEELAEGQFRGLGQRTLTAGDTDYPLLEVRTIEFTA